MQTQSRCSRCRCPPGSRAPRRQPLRSARSCRRSSRQVCTAASSGTTRRSRARARPHAIAQPQRRALPAGSQPQRRVHRWCVASSEARRRRGPRGERAGSESSTTLRRVWRVAPGRGRVREPLAAPAWSCSRRSTLGGARWPQAPGASSGVGHPAGVSWRWASNEAAARFDARLGHGRKSRRAHVREPRLALARQ